MLKVMVCGSKDSSHNEIVFDAMSKYFSENPVGILVKSNQKGVDAYAGHLSQNYNYQIRKYHAEYRILGISANFIRNKKAIIDEYPDIIIFFPTKYSWSIHRTIRYARRKGIKMLVYPLD